jgi:hypothetical protein
MAALLAVYRDRGTADAAAEALHSRAGIESEALRVGDWHDAQVAIAAEMDEEVDTGWASGVFGFATAEMIRGAALFGLLAATAGFLAGLPIGYFLYDASSSTWTRLAVGGLVGGLFGAVVGAMLGGGMAVKSPEEPLAGDLGVPVLVADAPEGAESVMSAYHPLRIDRFEDGHHIATIPTEPPHRIAHTVKDFAANARDPSRR